MVLRRLLKEGSGSTQKGTSPPFKVHAKAASMFAFATCL